MRWKRRIAFFVLRGLTISKNQKVYFPDFKLEIWGKAFSHRIQTAPQGFLQGKKSHGQLSIKIHLNQ
jgi:hypothetical protein